LSPEKGCEKHWDKKATGTLRRSLSAKEDRKQARRRNPWTGGAF